MQSQGKESAACRVKIESLQHPGPAGWPVAVQMGRRPWLIAHLRRGPRHDKVARDAAPVALAKLGQAQEEQAVLLFCPGDPLAALLFRFGPFRFLSRRCGEKSEQEALDPPWRYPGRPCGRAGTHPIAIVSFSSIGWLRDTACIDQLHVVLLQEESTTRTGSDGLFKHSPRALEKIKTTSGSAGASQIAARIVSLYCLRSFQATLPLSCQTWSRKKREKRRW